MPANPMLSVIVATLNSYSNAPLLASLGSVGRQKFAGKVELIVVDGGSVDKTVECAEAFGATVLANPNVTELGFDGGKNFGLMHAKGDFVIMLDADNILMEENYFDLMMKPLLGNEELAMTVPAPYVPEIGTAPGICRYFCLQELSYWEGLSSTGRQCDSWIEFTPSSAVVPNAGVISRPLLKEIGGWDYDTEVAARLIARGNNRFAFVPGAHRFHAEMLNYGDVFRKFSRRARHQVANRVSKPTVAQEMRRVKRDPLGQVIKEIVLPLKRGVESKDPTYFHSIPVALIKSFEVARWRMTHHGSGAS